MSQHTQGPWLAEYMGPNQWDVDAELRGSGQGTRWKAVATVFGGQHGSEPISDDEAEANARLIAAAPELLAAINAILADPHGCPFCDSGNLRSPNKPHDDNCGFKLAYDARAKAEGR